MVVVYKIANPNDTYHKVWYGDKGDLIKYLEETLSSEVLDEGVKVNLAYIIQKIKIEKASYLISEALRLVGLELSIVYNKDDENIRVRDADAWTAIESSTDTDP